MAGKRQVRPKAVLFDMDGVLVDSMPYHFLSWFETLIPFGVRVSCYDVYIKEGEYWEKSVRDFLLTNGMHPSPKLLRAIFRKRHEVFRKTFKRHIFQGAQTLLHDLKGSAYRIGLVSGTPMREVRKILPRSMRLLLDAIVAGDCVRNGKPSPEPYLRAASLLGVHPYDCLVIENAPLGIASAKNAGMFCVGVMTSLPKEYLKQADVVIGKLQDLYTILPVKVQKEGRR